MPMTPRLIRTLVWVFAVSLSVEAIHRAKVVEDMKNFRLVVFIGSVIVSSVLPMVSALPDISAGRIPHPIGRKMILFNLGLTYALAPLFFIAWRLQYWTIFPIVVGLRILINGQIDRRNPGSHALINRVTIGIVALSSLTQSRISTVACAALLVLSAVSVDRLLEERFSPMETSETAQSDLNRSS